MVNPQNKIRVVFCTNTFDSSNHGPAKFARLIREINSVNTGIELVTLTRDIIQSKPGVYVLHDKFAKVLRPIYMLAINIDYVIGLRSLKKNFDYDLVVFNNAITGVLFKMLYRGHVKVIGMINDENSLSRQNYTMAGSFKYILRFKIFRFVEKFSAKRFDMIIANSRYIRGKIIKEYSVPSEKVGLVYKGIEVSKFPEYQTKTIDQKGTIKILFVKSDPVVGGLKYLIGALEQMNTRRIELIIVGDQGPINYVPKGSHLSIDYRGLVTEDGVYKIMKEEAHIFCVPSIKEGLGVANMEAALHSLPIIATRVGGVPEVLTNNALLIRPGSTTDIIAAIEKVLDNENLAQSLTFAAYSDIRSRFSHENALQMFTNCLDIALN